MPDQCISFELLMGVDKAVTIATKRYASAEEIAKLTNNLTRRQG